jgi:hypothetical protein
MAKSDLALSYRDYEALPADGRRYELHEGERRTIEALVLGPAAYAPAVRAADRTPGSAPPSPDLVVIPDSLWE